MRAFYFWKSDEPGISFESREVLSRLAAGKLYVKTFEVEPGEVMGPVPAPKTSLRYLPENRDTEKVEREIVPVIYIQDAALTGLSQQAIDTLAGNINLLTNKYLERMSEPRYLYQELQLDCDWSQKNQQTYFTLLKAIKKKSGKYISCTLRLYPFKYRERMGVPPVDRAMLMCYNLLNPAANVDKNTIFSTRELAAYLGRKSTYPVPLDIALPAYSLARLYRSEKFVQTLQIDDISYQQVLKPLKPFWYEVTRDTTVGSAYVRAGDLIKYEHVAAGDLLESVGLLREHISLPPRLTVAYFHLDESLLNRYSYETLDSVYRSFSH